LELVTGLAASKKKGIKIESRKFGRFGLKLTVWLGLFFIINSLRVQYKGTSEFVYGIYEWLHDGLMIYVSLEYLISVIENLGTLTGKRDSGLINAIKKKVGMVDDGYNDFFNINADLLTILNRDGHFIKLNEAWTEVTGWSKNELLASPIISFIHKDDVKKTKEENTKLNTDGSYKSINFINRFKTKNGAYLTMSWSSKAGSGGNIYSTIRIVD
jgi:PAS domain S-box-containing protein